MKTLSIYISDEAYDYVHNMDLFGRKEVYRDIDRYLSLRKENLGYGLLNQKEIDEIVEKLDKHISALSTIKLGDNHNDK